jgi:hypothetical protein
MYLIPTLFSLLYILGAVQWYILFKAILYLLEDEHNDVSVLIKSSVWPLLAVNMIIDNLFVHDDEEDEE